MDAKEILQRCQDAFPELNILDAFQAARSAKLILPQESDFIIGGMPSWINKTFDERAAEWEKDFAKLKE